MKKLLSIFLVIVIVLGLCSCGKKAESKTRESRKEKDHTEQTTETESKQSQKMSSEYSETTETDDDSSTDPSTSETRHFNIWDDETHIEYKREKGFYTKYCDEMIEEAKKRLPDEISKITVYKVNTERISRYDRTITVKDQYDLNVSSISCDLDSVKCMEANTMTTDSWSSKPTGIVLLLTVNVRVVGTRTDTKDVIEETYISSFIVSRMGMTMTMDASEILDEGEIAFNFQHLDTCYGYFEYWINSSYLQDRKLLDGTILEYIALYSDPDHISSYSSKEETAYYGDFWNDFHGLFAKSIQEDVSIFFDGHTGLEDPAKQQRETADPNMGDGDDEPWDENDKENEIWKPE